MTLQTVMQALNQGYAISTVIKSVMNMNTPFAKSIKEALRQGYNEDQIGEYLTKGKSSSYSQRKAMLPGMTEEEKARGILYHQPKTEKNIGNLLKDAAMAAPLMAAGNIAGPAIGAALGRAAPAMGSALTALAPQAANALKRAAPQLFGQGATPGAAAALKQATNPTQSPAIQTAAQTALPAAQLQTNTSQPPVNQVAPSIAQTPQAVQPEGISKAKDFLEKKGLLKEVDDLLKAGNDPEGVAAAIGMKRSGKTKIDPELLQAVDDYAKSMPQVQQPNAPIEPEAPAAADVNPLDIEAPEEAKPIAKNDIAASPQGVGHVLEVRGNKALIEIDGKKHQVNLDELETEPETVKNIDYQKMAKEYINSIPESERSTAMLINFFQPTDTNQETGEEMGQFFVMFPSDPEHMGVYNNVSKELVDKINSASNVAKTTGETTLGKHTAGEADSRYAGATELRMNPDKYPYSKVPVPYNLAKWLFEANRQNEKERQAAERKAKAEEKKRNKALKNG